MSRRESCRSRLVDRSQDPRFNPRIRIGQVKKRFSELASSRQTPENRVEHVFLSLELEKLYADISEFWQQRSQTNWMREGDRNTAFFHAKAATRRETNQVEELVDKNGVKYKTKEGMESVAVEYFADLFASGRASNGGGADCNRIEGDG